MAIIRNAIVALEKSKVPIFKDTIVKVLEEQQNLGIEPKLMLVPANIELLCESAKIMIDSEISN